MTTDYGTRESLRKQMEAYLKTVPDDEGDEWDYKEERVISYREETRRTLMEFLHWLRKGEQDDDKE